MPLASKTDAGGDQIEIAKTFESNCLFDAFGGVQGDLGRLEELLIELLTHLMVDGSWLAGC